MKSPPKRQGKLRLKSPAKITPWVHILGRRSDGYHEVDLCLVPVSLYDELEIEVLEEGPIRVRVQGGEGLGALEDNLVLRAARAIEEELDTEIAADIELVKRIPWGAGLGGGSGNAAATLLALNRILGEPVSRPRLTQIALSLGSDVPFFLDPRPQRAQGRGERLNPLRQFANAALIVVKPALSIPTQQAYARVRNYGVPWDDPEPGSFTGLLNSLHNDFEIVLFPVYPVLREIKERVLELGASGALLSGSGSAVCGYFETVIRRERALERLSGISDWTLHPCSTLERHEYFAVET